MRTPEGFTEKLECRCGQLFSSPATAERHRIWCAHYKAMHNAYEETMSAMKDVGKVNCTEGSKYEAKLICTLADNLQSMQVTAGRVIDDINKISERRRAEDD